MLDETDWVLIRELENNARATNRDLAAAAGVVPSTALVRIRALRDSGVISGYHAHLSLEAVGRTVQAMVSVRIRPPSRKVIAGFREWAIQLPETLNLFVTAGGWDFLMHVAVADTGDLYAFIRDKLSARPEVTDVNTNMVYEHVRSPHTVAVPRKH